MTGRGIDTLRQRIADGLRRQMVAVDAVVPYDRGELVARARTSGEVEEGVTRRQACESAAPAGDDRLGAHRRGPERAPRTSVVALSRVERPAASAHGLVLEGHLSIEAALEAGHARSIASGPSGRAIAAWRLRALAREAGVARIDRVEADRIDEIASSRSHGGVVAIVGYPAYGFRPRAAR